MEIQRKESDEDYCWILGLRNSHDKTFPAGIIAGLSVFICDNLGFSGEVKLARKHTTHIIRDLPRLVQSAVGKLMDRWHHQAQRSPARPDANRDGTLDSRNTSPTSTARPSQRPVLRAGGGSVISWIHPIHATGRL